MTLSPLAIATKGVCLLVEAKACLWRVAEHRKGRRNSLDSCFMKGTLVGRGPRDICVYLGEETHHYTYVVVSQDGDKQPAERRGEKSRRERGSW